MARRGRIPVRDRLVPAAAGDLCRGALSGRAARPHDRDRAQGHRHLCAALLRRCAGGRQFDDRGRRAHAAAVALRPARQIWLSLLRLRAADRRPDARQGAGPVQVRLGHDRRRLSRTVRHLPRLHEEFRPALCDAGHSRHAEVQQGRGVGAARPQYRPAQAQRFRRGRMVGDAEQDPPRAEHDPVQQYHRIRDPDGHARAAGRISFPRASDHAARTRDQPGGVVRHDPGGMGGADRRLSGLSYRALAPRP